MMLFRTTVNYLGNVIKKAPQDRKELSKGRAVFLAVLELHYVDARQLPQVQDSSHGRT